MSTSFFPELGPLFGPPVVGIGTSDPLAWRGDWLNFRVNGRIHYLGDNEATDEACSAYRAKGYTDILVASNLGPQPGADEPFDMFGDTDTYVNRLQGFTSRGIRCIGQIGFEDNWTVWQKYANDFPAHLRRFAQAAHPHVSSWCWGVEIDEGITRGHYSWDDLIAWMVVLASVSDKPQTCWMRQTAWGPEGAKGEPGTAYWHGGKQAAWWKEVRRRLPSTPLGMAFQHRHDQPEHQRGNGAFLSPKSDVIDHVTALLTPQRLGDIGVRFLSAEYAYSGHDPDHPRVSEEEAAAIGDLALSLGAYGVLNGCSK